MSLLRVGDILDAKYRIEELLGMGGMAHVYKAADLKTQKLVAVKVLKEEFSQDAEFVRRFRSEAQAVLHLSHESLVRFFDVGQSGDYQYIVLEYIEGVTLKQVIRQEAPFEPQRAIHVALQLCSALSHAHERNLIHRDVKPQNIIINQQTGKLKLTDFGIARFADATTQTYAGTNVLGSVHYISPEQARGETADAKSDIYSLGIVLYEMLTGSVPFNSENTVSVAIKHIQEEMAPPTSINPRVGAALNAIVMKATRKDPQDRYASMRDFRKDLLRAMREPDRDFVSYSKKRADKGGKQSGSGKAVNAIVAFTVLAGLLVTVFFIARAMVDASTGNSKTYVPNLIGKTEQEAFALCDEWSLKLSVRSRENNPSVEPGVIYAQNPQKNSEVRKGETVYVDISEGEPGVVVPELTGIPLSEAQKLLQDMPVTVEIRYEYSEKSDGTVLLQIPDSGTELQSGDVIELVVSGEEDDTELVPSLVGKQEEEALSLAKGAGFDNIWISYNVDEALDGNPGQVVSQIPLEGEPALRTAALQLWVKPPASFAYAADTVFNLDVAEQDSKVLVVGKNGDVTVILVEKTLPAGRHPLPLHIEANTGGEWTVTVSINGEHYESKTVKLTRRE